MFKNPIKFQASIFVDSKEITPTSSNFIKFLGALESYELLPNTVQEITPSGALVDRIRLATTDNSFSLVIATNRIDIELQTNDINIPIGKTIDEFSKQICDMWTKITPFFLTLPFRLALLGTYFNDKESNGLHEKLFKSSSFYTDFPPFEWTYRLASLKTISGEETNIITKIDRTLAELKNSPTTSNPINATILALDINTSPKNTSPRFTQPNLDGFYSEAPLEFVSLLENINSFIK
ncbi:hypothetical protein P1X15_31300 [Runella sp. MFBS21]|uniref:hypothetical protein n=1 Tax=Runella sp. MFBS21 TaxID=3034018 RepID=UPI0023F93D37|nr:hypothetical protein [Runella sp. MFBS21]MDF7822143.1 hypothetical protein [Runella sp. MFBS21]